MKNTCKKIIKLSAVLALAGMPAALMANPITSEPTVSLTLNTLDTTEFSIPNGTEGYGGPFNASTSANGNFITFCVQTEVDINTSTTYYYTLSQSDSSGVLTLGAAYLYSSYLNGSLGQFTTATEYGELQAAIWTLQGQNFSNPSALGSLTSNPYLIDAVNAATALGKSDTNASNGAYGVEIMNITDSTGDAVQNQLIEVPDACSTALLLGAMLPVGFILRKKLGMVAAKN